MSDNHLIGQGVSAAAGTLAADGTHSEVPSDPAERHLPPSTGVATAPDPDTSGGGRGADASQRSTTTAPPWMLTPAYRLGQLEGATTHLLKTITAQPNPTPELTRAAAWVAECCIFHLTHE
jgi:hypothetical protein